MNFSVDFRKYDGTVCHYNGSTLAPGGHFILATSDVYCLDPIDYYGSAVINATQPIAVTSSQAIFDNGVQQLLESPYSDEFSYPSGAIAPLVQNYNYGYYSGLSAQNAGSSYGNINTLYFRQYYGTACDGDYDPNVQPGKSVFHITPGNQTCPYSYLGARTNSAVQVATVINQLRQGTYEGADYPGITKLGRQIIFPVWKKGWGSGIVLFNPYIYSSTLVSLKFYNQDGSMYQQLPSIMIQPNDYVAITGQPSGTNWSGSLVVLSEYPIAGIANHTPGTFGDKIVSHKGVHRFP